MQMFNLAPEPKIGFQLGRDRVGHGLFRPRLRPLFAKQPLTNGIAAIKRPLPDHRLRRADSQVIPSSDGALAFSKFGGELLGREVVR